MQYPSAYTISTRTVIIYRGYSISFSSEIVVKYNSGEEGYRDHVKDMEEGTVCSYTEAAIKLKNVLSSFQKQLA